MDDQQIHAAIMKFTEEMASLKENLKSTWKRIDEQKQLVETVHDLTLSLRDLANTQENSMKTITDLRRDVDEIKAKPAKRWESIVATMLAVAVTAVVTYLVSAAGLK